VPGIDDGGAVKRPRPQVTTGVAQANAPIRAAGSAAPVIVAFSVARLTLAATPGNLFSFFSTRAAQDAQVMPPIASSTGRVSSIVVIIYWASA
jgi:hypothetical protein